ncbi:MAG: hypothetical protein EOO50_07030 [Flavobacterium sp.]|uniref:hypothetical protein n=1 Tax=Flavobacterium sp. TaxID=239 RepID=UPI0011F8DF8B|nr:hypothetical protein [Flavobacterium sp.]RZJ67009.1 MAG: hypothetical protein EOO50_07030 [Flavobacterium sp.]
MENNLFEQIKNAETNAESQEFPGIESVWSRVEDKLDNRVLVKQNKKWKQWAVAASVLLVASLGYQVYRTETTPETKIKIVKNQTVLPEIEADDAVANAVADTTVIRKDAPQILKKEIQSGNIANASEVVVSPNAAAPMSNSAAEAMEPSIPLSDDIENDDSGMLSLRPNREKGTFRKGNVFPARSVRRDGVEVSIEDLKKDKNTQPEKKSKPLLIVDGKPVVAKSDAEYDKKLEDLEYGRTKRDTIIHLEKPLYVINGVEYSEESLFGPNPTSPYAPLNLQEEGMTTTILTGREAESAYGAKGRNGVVIITTKNGRPAPKK